MDASDWALKRAKIHAEKCNQQSFVVFSLSLVRGGGNWYVMCCGWIAERCTIHTCDRKQRVAGYSAMARIKNRIVKLQSAEKSRFFLFCGVYWNARKLDWNARTCVCTKSPNVLNATPLQTFKSNKSVIVKHLRQQQKSEIKTLTRNDLRGNRTKCS